MKKMIIVTSALLLTFGLAGCGKSPKEAFIDANKEMQNIKTAEFNTALSLKINDPNNKLGDPSTLETINNAKISFSGLVDIPNKKYEVTTAVKAKMGAMNLDLSMPFFLNGQKLYIKGDDLSSVGSMIPVYGSYIETIKGKISGKYIEVDSSNSNIKIDEEKEKTFESKIKNEVYAFISNLPDNNFVKKGEITNISIPGDKATDLILNIAKEASEFTPDSQKVTKEDLEKAKQEISKEITIGAITVSSSLNNKDKKMESFSIPVTFKGEDYNGITATIVISTTYSNINKPVHFNFNIKSDNVINQKQLEKLMGNAVQASSSDESTDSSF